MSIVKHSRYAPQSQEPNPDAAGIEAAFTDLIAAYVASRNTKPYVPRTTGLRPDDRVLCGRLYCNDYSIPQKTSSPDVQLNTTSNIPHVINDNSLSTNQFPITDNGYSITDSEQSKCAVDVERGVRFCAETSRIALGLKKSPHLQRYLPLHDAARRNNGKQGFTYPEFYALMDEYGVQGTRQYHARILREGRGLFWNIANGMIYPCGFVELSLRLCKLAYQRGLHDLYAADNFPGQRKDMYIRVSGSCVEFEGAILASWYAAHNCPTISRWTLERLFNRDRRSIWHIEAYSGVKIIYNEAETTEPTAVPLNSDGSDERGDVYRTIDKKTGEIVYHFRLANTYQAGHIRQHNRKGQGRKAVYTFKQWVDSIELHTNSEGGDSNIPVQVNPIGRLYCADYKAMKRSRKRGRAGQLYIRWKPGRGGGIVWRVDSVVSISHNI